MLRSEVVRRQKAWYGWAFIEPTEGEYPPFGSGADLGLEYARELAESGITVEQLAARLPGRRKASTMHWQIWAARRTLHGKAARSTIFRRAARRRELERRDWRQCVICGEAVIPPDARSDRTTCSVRCRVAKSRGAAVIKPADEVVEMISWRCELCNRDVFECRVDDPEQAWKAERALAVHRQRTCTALN